jgi:hypothetical protein
MREEVLQHPHTNLDSACPNFALMLDVAGGDRRMLFGLKFKIQF